MVETNRVRSCKKQLAQGLFIIFDSQWTLGVLLIFTCPSLFPYYSSQVLEVLAAIRNEPKEALAETIYKNTTMMFFPNE